MTWSLCTSSQRAAPRHHDNTLAPRTLWSRSALACAHVPEHIDIRRACTGMSGSGSFTAPRPPPVLSRPVLCLEARACMACATHDVSARHTAAGNLSAGQHACRAPVRHRVPAPSLSPPSTSKAGSTGCCTARTTPQPLPPAPSPPPSSPRSRRSRHHGHGPRARSRPRTRPHKLPSPTRWCRLMV